MSYDKKALDLAKLQIYKEMCSNSGAQEKSAFAAFVATEDADFLKRFEIGDCSIENIQTGGKKRLRKTRKILKGGNQKPRIHCISVSTKDNEGLQRLLNSAKANNVTIEILGLDMNTDKLGHSAKQKFEGYCFLDNKINYKREIYEN